MNKTFKTRVNAINILLYNRICRIVSKCSIQFSCIPNVKGKNKEKSMT